MRLSNTKKNMYYECPRKYKHKYIDNISSEKLASPLFFGRAVDEALNYLLLQKKKKLTKEEKKLLKESSEIEIFTNLVKSPTHNGEVLCAATTSLISYSKSDLDESLLDPETFDIERIKALKSLKTKLNEEDQAYINKASAESLYQKGLMLLEHYKQEIMPLIKEVISIQEQVSLKDDDDNELTGIIDFVGIFEDEPDTIYVIDNKTTSVKYKSFDEELSEQLATYCEYKKNYNAAYIVLDKYIRKKDPRVRSQVIKGVIDEDGVNKTFDKYDNMRDNVEAGNFEPDFSSKCYFYGRPCEYYNLCHNNDSTGLVKVVYED